MASNTQNTMEDVNELQRLAQLAHRPHVKSFLQAEIQRLLTTVPAKTSESSATQSSASATTNGSTAKARENKAYACPIKSYGWDQTPTSVKIYVTLDGVGGVPTDQVQVTFTDGSFSVLVENLNGKTHSLSVRLSGEISPTESSFKVKKNAINISLGKTKPGSWSHLTAKEKKDDVAKKSKFDTPSPSPSEDPSAGLMGMLKKMYDDGDDEMKRTLSKAWVESQEKQARGEFGSV